VKTVYLVRHCKAAGQEPAAPLTAVGLAQAEALPEFFAPLGVGRVVSSPYTRAVRSAQPLAARLGLPVETDARFGEWVLAGEMMPTEEEALRAIRACLADPTLAHPGGESGADLTARGLAGLEDALSGPAAVTAVFLHGGILSHLLRHHLPTFGFADWQRLTNPDVYRLTVGADGAREVERVWTEEKKPEARSQ
jgi:2,3-bisphosphoglycerate-dependent phosphoglycerate mutase